MPVLCKCGAVVDTRWDSVVYESWVVGDHGCSEDGEQFFDSQLISEEEAEKLRTQGVVDHDTKPATTQIEERQP